MTMRVRRWLTVQFRWYFGPLLPVPRELVRVQCDAIGEGGAGGLTLPAGARIVAAGLQPAIGDRSFPQWYLILDMPKRWYQPWDFWRSCWFGARHWYWKRFGHPDPSEARDV